MIIQDKEQFFYENITPFEKDLARYIWNKICDEEDTADILQNTFLEAWRSLDSLRSVESAKSWLYAIANNCINLHFRRKKKQVRIVRLKPTEDGGDPLGEIYSTEESVLGQILEHFDGDLAIRALDYLESKEKDLIIMRYIKEFGTKQIMEKTGLKEKTLSCNLCRALKKYKQIYFDLEQGKEVSGKHGKK